GSPQARLFRGQPRAARQRDDRGPYVRRPDHALRRRRTRRPGYDHREEHLRPGGGEEPRASSRFLLTAFSESKMAWSRDSFHWQRAAARRIFALRGRNPEAWDRYQIYPGGYPVKRPAAGCATELWLYYEGWNGPHNQEARQSKVGLAKIRPHGFV